MTVFRIGMCTFFTLAPNVGDKNDGVPNINNFSLDWFFTLAPNVEDRNDYVSISGSGQIIVSHPLVSSLSTFHSKKYSYIAK